MLEATLIENVPGHLSLCTEEAFGPITCPMAVNESGQGREGIRFAMEDMSEIRKLQIRTL